MDCDYYVLLAHVPLDDARRLAKEVPVFDLVVASGETSLPSDELEHVEGTKTRLMQVGLKAMYVGVVGLFDDREQPVATRACRWMLALPIPRKCCGSWPTIKIASGDGVRRAGNQDTAASERPPICGQCQMWRMSY